MSLKEYWIFEEKETLIIRLQLQGGVGNQLFIWTMAHELSKIHKCHVQLVFLKDHLQRADRLCEIGELQNYCEHDISIVESRIWSFVLRAIDKMNTVAVLSKLNVAGVLGIEDMKNSYELPVLKKKPPRFVRGYFQSYMLVEKNAADIYFEINSFFQRSSNVGPNSSSYNVSHIRRGDTVLQAIPVGLLSYAYYKKYTENDKQLIICTDDETFVSEISLAFPNSLVIPPNENETWEILKLMAHADCLIMANSTLSWWAGWFLSKTPGRKVVFPSPWRPYDPLITDNLMIQNVQVAPSMFEEK